jgi:restriction system protein
MPKRRNSALDQVSPLIASLPWWGWLPLAAVSFAGFHWFAESWSPLVKSLLLALTAAFVFATAVSIIGGSTRSERSLPAGEPPKDEKREPVLGTDRWSPELLQALEWKRFEFVCAAYFETLGFRSNVAREGPDGGIDIHLYAGASSKPDIIVQCKAWKSHMVGVKEMRELLGVMTYNHVDEGAFVTTGTYTTDARQFAAKANISLIDGEDLLAKIAATSAKDHQELLLLATEGDFTTPTCPSCGVKMVRRVANKTGESFWGCVDFPRCRLTFRATS